MFLFVDNNVGILFILGEILPRIIKEIIRFTTPITRLVEAEVKLW